MHATDTGLHPNTNIETQIPFELFEVCLEVIWGRDLATNQTVR